MPNLNISKSFIPFSLLLFVIFSAIVFGQKASTPKCVEQDYDAQIVEANKGIKFSPYNMEAYLKRGDAYMSKIEYDKALKDFNRVLEIQPKSAEAFIYRGTLYDNRGNYDQSIADFTMAIEINPENAENYYMRGRAYTRKDENSLAMEDFDKAIRLNDDIAIFYYGRGRQYQLAGRKTAAATDFNKAIEILGREIELNYNDCQNDGYIQRGIVYLASNNIRQAISDFIKAVAIKQSEQAYFYRGLLYLDNKNYKASVDDFTKAIELNSEFAENYKGRAEAYEKLNKKDEAERDRQKYKELSGKR